MKEILIQDVFFKSVYDDLDTNIDHMIYVFHTHGIRQALGTCKIHLKSNCHILIRWRPGAGLGKIIMRDMRDVKNISEGEKCKFCWR